MRVLSSPTWRRRLVRAVFAIGVWCTGVWADFARGRTPDYFDLQTAIVHLFFAWVLAELCDGVIDRLQQTRIPWPAAMALFGAIFVALAHATPSFLIGVMQIPLGGLAMLRSVVEGLFFTLRQALLPALVCGALAGLIGAFLRPRAIQLQPSNG
jgi:hypothetical protein